MGVDGRTGQIHKQQTMICLIHVFNSWRSGGLVSSLVTLHCWMQLSYSFLLFLGGFRVGSLFTERGEWRLFSGESSGKRLATYQKRSSNLQEAAGLVHGKLSSLFTINITRVCSSGSSGSVLLCNVCEVSMGHSLM